MKRLALPVASYAVLLVSALQTLVVPVVANIQADLGVSATSAAWVVTANLPDAGRRDRRAGPASA